MCNLVALLTCPPGMGFASFRTSHAAVGIQESLGAALLAHCWEVLGESRNMSRLPLVTLTYILNTFKQEKSREQFLRQDNVSPRHPCR